MEQRYRVFVWLHRLASLGFFAVLLAEDESVRTGLALICTTGMLPVVKITLFLSMDIIQVLAGNYEFWFITALNVLHWACFALILRDARVLNGIGSWLAIQTVVMIDANYRTSPAATRLPPDSLCCDSRNTEVCRRAPDPASTRDYRVKLHDRQAAPGPAAHANASLVIEVLDKPEAQAHPGSAPILPQTLEEVADPTLVHHRRGGVRLHQHRMDPCAERDTTQLAAGQFFNRRRSYTFIFVITFGTMLQHEVMYAMIFNFDFVFSAVQVYLLTLCLAGMLRWHLYRSLAVFSCCLWFQWVLCQDGLMPIVKRRLRYKKRYAAPVMGMILLSLVSLLIRIFDDDSNLFVDHVVLDIRVSASRDFALHVKAIALQRIVTILCWSTRLVHGLASTLKEELLFIRGSVEYMSPFDVFPG